MARYLRRNSADLVTVDDDRDGLARVKVLASLVAGRSGAGVDFDLADTLRLSPFGPSDNRGPGAAR